MVSMRTLLCQQSRALCFSYVGPPLPGAPVELGHWLLTSAKPGGRSRCSHAVKIPSRSCSPRTSGFPTTAEHPRPRRRCGQVLVRRADEPRGAPFQQGESHWIKHSIPIRPARDIADPATGWQPRTAHQEQRREGWDVRPTLDRASATGRSLAQAAGSFVAGSPLPQALIQCPTAAHPTSFDCAPWSSCRGQHRSLWQATRRWPSSR